MKGTVPATILLVLLMGTLGFWHGINMDGSMSGCPLMAHTASLCGVNPVEHIALWQRLFTGIPQRALVLMLVLAGLGSVLPTRAGKHALSRIGQILYQFYQRLMLAFTPFEPLRYAFSQGILQPKICG